jgi:hypothetical protein
VIRVGGRCKNEKVDAYNLSKLRRSGPRHSAHEIWQLREKIEKCNPEKIWQNLNRHYSRRTLLPMFIIQHVAHPYHFYQLTQMARCAEQHSKEVEVWLGLWQEILSEAKAKRKGERKKLFMPRLNKQRKVK